MKMKIRMMRKRMRRIMKMRRIIKMREMRMMT